MYIVKNGRIFQFFAEISMNNEREIGGEDDMTNSCAGVCSFVRMRRIRRDPVRDCRTLQIKKHAEWQPDRFLQRITPQAFKDLMDYRYPVIKGLFALAGCEVGRTSLVFGVPTENELKYGRFEHKQLARFLGLRVKRGEFQGEPTEDYEIEDKNIFGFSVMQVAYSLSSGQLQNSFLAVDKSKHVFQLEIPSKFSPLLDERGRVNLRTGPNGIGDIYIPTAEAFVRENVVALLYPAGRSWSSEIYGVQASSGLTGDMPNRTVVDLFIARFAMSAAPAFRLINLYGVLDRS
jgi:hypothetical protein